MRRSERQTKVPARFLEDEEETGGQLQETGATPQPQEFSDEEPSTSSSGRGRGRSPIHGHSQSKRGADGAGDYPRSRSPPHQEAWKTEADPDTANPHPPKFTPKRTPGVQPPLTTGTQTPGDIFSLFFDMEVLQFLCTNTNKYGKINLEKGKKLAWTDITPQELKKYLGLLQFTSVCSLPKMSDFWRQETIFRVPFPAMVMSRDRFTTITSNLHMSDPEEDAVNDQRKGTEDYDPLQKVRSLLEMIGVRCKSIYHPKQHLSVEERMVATRARGLKFVVLADVTGYTVDYKLYTEKNHGASGKGLSFDVVAELVDRDYLGRGYVVYCDNFNTSPLLFRHLSQQGFGACGTYRQNRVDAPTTQENALDRKSKRGSIRWIRDGDLFVKWMDTREVSICSTVHPVYTGETVLRWQKRDGHAKRVSVPRPTAVDEYNKYMGGVDTSDQMLGTNSVHRKWRRWPMTVFQHLVDIAVTNSFIVHKELSVMQQQKPKTRQDFLEELCAGMLSVPLAGPPTQGHFPVPTSTREQTGKRQRAALGRKQCILCKRSTPWMCGECRVGLCLQLDRNCFKDYHT